MLKQGQRSKQALALLEHRGEVAADATKGRRTIFAAKGARHFLLHFDHAQVALGLIVGKRNR
jgi:hypothetical protein